MSVAVLKFEKPETAASGQLHTTVSTTVSPLHRRVIGGCNWTIIVPLQAQVHCIVLHPSTLSRAALARGAPRLSRDDVVGGCSSSLVGARTGDDVRFQ
jgi:hypothetical protein